LLQADGAAPVAPSAIVAATSKCFVVQPDGVAANVPAVVPRALATDEMAGVIAQYRQAAARADRAGFDFVEIHAANGYLPHQFLSTNTNHRTDQYGGSIENRARFLLEAVDAAIAEMGADRVGVRLSPHFVGHDMADQEADASTLYLAKEFTRRGIAYLHIAEPDWVGGPELSDEFRRQIRADFKGLLIFCGGYSAAEADALIANGIGDAVGFGRPFLANPDLVERFRLGAELNAPDQSTFYGGDARGYIDYPALKQAA
jgi:N-ethylmaleimide reductase